MERIRLVFKKRKYYYLFFFIVGYLLIIPESGVPNWMYWIPLKGPSFVCAMGLGNAIYYGWVERENPIIGTWRILKWILASFIIIIMMKFIQIVIQSTFNIDIGPMFGFYDG
mgnify:FL=1